jgi:hypothetical protein
VAGPDREEVGVNGAPCGELVAPLVGVLDTALRLLGDRGEEDEACRLGARAWALVAPEHEREARRLNGTLHYLTRARREAL